MEGRTEEKKTGKTGGGEFKIIEVVYNALIKDKEILKQIERINEQEWMKIIEGN